MSRDQFLTRGERRERRRRNQRKHRVSNRSIFTFWRSHQQRQIDAITGGGVSVEEYATEQQRLRDQPEPPCLPRPAGRQRKAS